MHELGHILASVILKMRICEINFGIANIDICKPKDYYVRKFSEKAILILSGCILNFVIFFVFWALYLWTKKLDFLYVAEQSMGIAMLNMFPIESLDGGELLGLFIEKFAKNFERAKKIYNFISWLFLFVLAILGVFVIIRCKYGFPVVLLIMYLVYQKYV